jgi:hypothetical protein
MSKLILFVGNIDNSPALAAKQYDDSAISIFTDNLKDLEKIKVGYVSIGDHQLKDFINILDYASEIHYVHSDTWGDINTKLNTECYLKYFSHRKPVYNFTKDLYSVDSAEMLELVDSRRHNDQQLWVAGDSFTVGTPWVNPDQIYGHLLSKNLNLPVSYLASIGSSISWAADQILRSDIRKDDIVVFMLTSVSRFPYFSIDGLHHINRTWYPKFKNIVSEQILTSPHLRYLACRSIDQVITDANKVGYKLVITKTPLDVEENEFFILNYLSNFDCFVHNYSDGTDGLIDYGNDGLHPGPIQHKQYADIILRHLKNENLS